MRRLQTITLAAAASEWLAFLDANGKAPATVRDHGYVIKSFSKIVGPQQSVRRLTAAHMTRVVAEWSRSSILKCSVQGSTLNTRRSIVGAFLKWCEVNDYLESAARVTFGMTRQKEVKRKRVYLTQEQCQHFLDSIEHPRDRILCAVAMFTGLRVSDITQLHVGSVDLTAKTIDTSILKTGDWDDQLPILKELQEELHRWLHWYAKSIRRPAHQQDYLIPAKERMNVNLALKDPTAADWGQLHPDRGMNKHNAGMRMGKHLRAAGLGGEGEGMHTLRRSVARILFDSLCEEGETSRDQALLIVKEMLHHSSVEMTMRYIGSDYGRELRNKVLHGRRLFKDTSAVVVQLPHAAGRDDDSQPTSP